MAPALCPLLHGRHPLQRSMSSHVVIPEHIQSYVSFGIVEAGENKSVYKFSLLYGMESLDICVFFRCCHVGEFLFCFHVPQSLTNCMCNKLGTIVITDKNALQGMTQMKHAHHGDDILLIDTALENPAEYRTAEYIYHGKLIIIPAF